MSVNFEMPIKGCDRITYGVMLLSVAHLEKTANEWEIEFPISGDTIARSK